MCLRRTVGNERLCTIGIIAAVHTVLQIEKNPVTLGTLVISDSIGKAFSLIFWVCWSRDAINSSPFAAGVFEVFLSMHRNVDVVILNFSSIDLRISMIDLVKTNLPNSKRS